MPSDGDDRPDSWIEFGSILIWTGLLIGLLLGFFAESFPLIRSTLIAAWGLFTLLFLWRIARGVEHLAYDTE